MAFPSALDVELFDLAIEISREDPSASLNPRWEALLQAGADPTVALPVVGRARGSGPPPPPMSAWEVAFVAWDYSHLLEALASPSGLRGALVFPALSAIAAHPECVATPDDGRHFGLWRDLGDWDGELRGQNYKPYAGWIGPWETLQGRKRELDLDGGAVAARFHELFPIMPRLQKIKTKAHRQDVAEWLSDQLARRPADTPRPDLLAQLRFADPRVLGVIKDHAAFRERIGEPGLALLEQAHLDQLVPAAADRTKLRM